MNRIISFWMLAFLGMWAFSCHRVEEQEPFFPEDTLTSSLPTLFRSVSDYEKIQIRIDSLVARDVNLSLKMGKPLYGSLSLMAGGQGLEYTPQVSNWHKDSVDYQLCRGIYCRPGRLVFFNLNYTPQADTILLPPIGPVYLNFLGTFQQNLLPAGQAGKIKFVRHRFFSSFIQGPDSTSLLYYSGGGSSAFSYGFDDLNYYIQTQAGKWYKGYIEFVIGDTCQFQAKSDLFFMSGDSLHLPASTLLANDVDCNGAINQGLVRIKIPPDYGDETSLTTAKGKWIERGAGSSKQISFVPHPGSFQSDSIRYYLVSPFNQRISRAWLKVKK